MVRVVGGVAAFVVAVVAHAAAFYFFVFGTCAVSDTANTVPARASAQGWVCGRSAEWEVWFPLMLAVLTASVVLAVVLAVRRKASVLGATACLWLPLLVFAVVSAPSDSCTDKQRRELPAYECDRTGNG